MTGRVIQGFFLGGQPRVAAGVVAPPKPSFAAQAKAGPRHPAPPPTAFATRTGAAQAKAGPPTPAFAPKPPVVAQLFGGNDAFAVDPARLGLNSGGGRALPDALRGKMEAAFGADFSSVRVHVGPQAERVGAIAFTLGQDIYFAPGRFQPDTVQGQQLLGHELAHVVQQRQGRVRNPLGSGVAVVQDRALEAEADRLGVRAAATVAPHRREVLRHAGRPVAATPVPGFGTVALRSRGILQAELTFTAAAARWMADKAQCGRCSAAMSKGHRHHCRVCGYSVCDGCAAQKYQVTGAQSAEGKRIGSSVGRVCVDCVLEKKKEIASRSSPEFSKLLKAAKDPVVRWEDGCWPNCSSRGITLNPRKGDFFATYIFELTNAVNEGSPMPKASSFADPKEYAYQIEYQEYLGTMWAGDVVEDINARQSDFRIEQRFQSKPEQGRFLEHLDAQLRGEHTKMYFEQATKDPTKLAKAKQDWRADIDLAKARGDCQESCVPSRLTIML